jgi:catechol 2,3-dioxygenase-like lactoylglutathione lyase family enzyme
VPSPLRLQHVALNVEELQACEGFYREILGLKVVWRPDVAIVAPSQTHRDGMRSLYCRDPDGNTVQLLHEPRAAGSRERARSGSRARERMSN